MKTRDVVYFQIDGEKFRAVIDLTKPCAEWKIFIRTEVFCEYGSSRSAYWRFYDTAEAGNLDEWKAAQRAAWKD